MSSLLLKYDIEIDKKDVDFRLQKITNQIYKLLPTREENKDWNKLLLTIFVELNGMNNILINYGEFFFPLLCKLEGLHSLDGENDFFEYRRVIFECLSIIGELRGAICL